MDYEEYDRLYPQQAERYRRAKEYYVLNGLEFTKLADKFELDARDLKTRAMAEGWTKLRMTQIQTSSEESIEANRKLRDAINAAGDDRLKRGLAVVDVCVGIAEEMAGALANPELEKGDFIILSARIRAFKELSEAMSLAVRLQREVRGLQEGDASVAPAQEKGQRVEYEVVIKPAV